MRDQKYILKGRELVPVDLMTWATWLQDNFTDRQVGRDELENGFEISTVFLGLDHNFGEGPPLLFETLVWNRQGDEVDGARYSTYDEAEAGHARMVNKWSGKGE